MDSRKIIVHPSVIEYDFRIAWTWDEMEKRNESNALKDKLRLACLMPWRPLYSVWKTHWGKDRPLPEIPDWR